MEDIVVVITFNTLKVQGTVVDSKILVIVIVNVIERRD